MLIHWKNLFINHHIRGVWLNLFHFFSQFFKRTCRKFDANIVDPYQTPCFGASDLSLQRLLCPYGKLGINPIALFQYLDDLRFYVLSNSISVISGQVTDDNERLCAMKPRLRVRRFRLEQGSDSGPLDQ